MKDWQKEGYRIGDIRSKARRRVDRERAMRASGMSWKATRRRAQ